MLKILLFTLLAANTAYFALSAQPNKALDAAAWLTLLALYEIQAHNARSAGTRDRPLLRITRLAAGLAVIGATIGYVFEENRLDAINSALWIAVVILLEIEVRFPERVQRRRTVYSVVAAALYGGLAMLVLIWSARAEWLDAYDALLWLIAFATIELNLLKAKPAQSAALTP